MSRQEEEMSHCHCQAQDDKLHLKLKRKQREERENNVPSTVRSKHSDKTDWRNSSIRDSCHMLEQSNDAVQQDKIIADRRIFFRRRQNGQSKSGERNHLLSPSKLRVYWCQEMVVHCQLPLSAIQTTIRNVTVQIFHAGQRFQHIRKEIVVCPCQHKKISGRKPQLDICLDNEISYQARQVLSRCH